MPRPSTGSPKNAATFLSAFGETVVLEPVAADQEPVTIRGIFRQRRETTYDGTTAREVTHTVVYVPDSLRDGFEQGRSITARGQKWYVTGRAAVGEDGWVAYPVSLATS